MILPNIDLDEQALFRLAQTYQLKEIYLFGSVLRDDFGPDSDIDIMIVAAEDAVLSYPDLCEMRENLENILHRSVDLVEKAGIINPYRQAEIYSTAVKIYAA
jgi:predicted nucleotidyltransferase